MKKFIPYKYRIFACCILLIVNSNFTKAQKAITLNQAIDEALKNNLTLKNEKLKTIYLQKLKQASTTIPQANLMAETGQINSIYQDTKFGLAQSFSFPTVYFHQHKMAIEEWKAAATSLAVREIELSKIIKQSFYSILILKQKEKLLLQTDTVYAEFLKKANLRLATGESNILEKASAESMQGAIHLQLKSIQQDVEMELLKFQLLLNTEDDIMPTSSVLKMNQTSIFDSISFQNHPTLNYFKHQQLLANDATNLERARLLPEISIGYFNTSIKGNGADNVFYTRANRFKSVQFSIGIPLFFKSQQYRIKASNIQQLMANNNFQNHYNEIKKDLKMAWLQYENNLRMVNYYEQTALPNASLITTTAQQQFTNGQINYLEWVMLMNQSVTIQNNYLDAIKSLNESIISIEYLTSK